MPSVQENICRDSVFEELFREHSTDLFQFLYYKYGKDNNPGDIVQDAFYKLWENCKTVSQEKARAYLFTVANNLMLNSLSRSKTALKFSQQPQTQHTSESPQYLMEESEYRDKLNKALEELSEDQRVTFMLNKAEGKRHKEIAEMLGISRKAVEKRIYKVLSILREKVDGI